MALPASSAHADEDLHWLALRMLPGLGMRKAVQLIETYRSPIAVFQASRPDLESCGLSRQVAQSIASGCTFEDAAEQQRRMQSAGTVLISYLDPRYPERLRSIFDPPLLLFASGDPARLDAVMIAVVGTRRPTPYGVAAAERLCQDLAQAGVTIVSGLARGVDTAAHRAALSVSGATAAVLGCGVDVAYPPENRLLAAEIASKGLLLSEFPMGAPPFPQNFPIRNRIISGLSSGVLIVEGAQYSGSAITARLAMDQGREVFAVPGNITSKMSWCPNLLIKQGAKLVQEWGDVVAELRPEERRRLASGSQTSLELVETASESFPGRELTEVEKALRSKLRVDAAIQLDDLLESLEYYSSSEVIAGLFELEMLGIVRQLPGKNFVKVW